jgi:hypothetical protein
MDSFSSRGQFTAPDGPLPGVLTPEALRYLNALEREIAALRAALAALTLRVEALEP